MAARQFGFVTRAQLLEIGIEPRAINRWVHSGRLVQVHAGVYGVGHAQRGALPRAMAAVLACGPRAVLSHDSAAALWGVRTWPSMPEVTAPIDHTRPGIRAHRSRTLTTKQVRRHHGIRVTSPARTITDIQDRLTDAQLIRAVNDLRLAKHLRQTELERLLTACPRAKALIDPAERPTRSPKEDEFLVFCAHYGLPRPKINLILHGHEVDALFPDEKVIVEIDGWDFHKTHESFESDRDKDADLAQYGYLTVRVTSTRLKDTPAHEAERLLTTLDKHRRPGSS
jgi:putative AbiEi antitoxin of type IV toxin-antitoxin system